MLKKALNTLHRGYQVNQGSGTKSNSIILFLQQSAQTVIQSTAKDERLYFLQRERAMSGEKHFVQRAVVKWRVKLSKRRKPHQFLLIIRTIVKP